MIKFWNCRDGAAKFHTSCFLFRCLRCPWKLSQTEYSRPLWVFCNCGVTSVRFLIFISYFSPRRICRRYATFLVFICCSSDLLILALSRTALFVIFKVHGIYCPVLRGFYTIQTFIFHEDPSVLFCQWFYFRFSGSLLTVYPNSLILNMSLLAAISMLFSSSSVLKRTITFLITTISFFLWCLFHLVRSSRILFE